MQNLRETAAGTKEIIKELKEGLWIGRGTRYVTIDFTIYNANINLGRVQQSRLSPQFAFSAAICRNSEK